MHCIVNLFILVDIFWMHMLLGLQYNIVQCYILQNKSYMQNHTVSCLDRAICKSQTAKTTMPPHCHKTHHHNFETHVNTTLHNMCPTNATSHNSPSCCHTKHSLANTTLHIMSSRLHNFTKLAVTLT